MTNKRGNEDECDRWIGTSSFRTSYTL